MGKGKSTEPATDPAVEEMQPKKPRYICTRPAPFGSRTYTPGEYLEVEEGAEVPREFMPCTVTGPDGTVETGPYFFALKEYVAPDGREFKPGMLWNSPAFLGLPPADSFAPLDQRGDYEWQDVSGVRRVYLCRKPPASPGPSPDRPAA